MLLEWNLASLLQPPLPSVADHIRPTPSLKPALSVISTIKTFKVREIKPKVDKGTGVHRTSVICRITMYNCYYVKLPV